MSRRHCRGCGGIFCENCCSNELVINDVSEPGCQGCFKGATPGEIIKDVAKVLIEQRGVYSPQALPFRMISGVLFGEGREFGGQIVSNRDGGYFELVMPFLKILSFTGCGNKQ